MHRARPLRPSFFRLLSMPFRPKAILAPCLACACVLLLLFVSWPDRWHDLVPWASEHPFSSASKPGPKTIWALVEEEKEKESHWNAEDPGHREDRLRAYWKVAQERAAKKPGTDAIYGSTLDLLVGKTDRKRAFQKTLRDAPKFKMPFSSDAPVHFNPYPDYNSQSWKKKGRAMYVSCNGPDGRPVQDVLAFRGRPANFPEPSMGSFDILDMDDKLCFERETRLGPYGFSNGSHWESRDWDQVNWGHLQAECLSRNKARFHSVTEVTPEEHVATPVRHTTRAEVSLSDRSQQGKAQDNAKAEDTMVREDRTAILLRAFTGKVFTENDQQNIRSLVAELALRSGGEYQIFILLHVKELPEGFSEVEALIDDAEARKAFMGQHVPAEFHDMVVLWHEQQIWRMYTQLTDQAARSVHEGQWLSVQKFSRERPEFEYIWNFEMDVRFTGHHYDFLTKLGSFARRQPRRGLWDRNDRFYIPSYHGNYETDFVPSVEALTSALRAAKAGARSNANPPIWGPIRGPPVGSVEMPEAPKPPANRTADQFEWGVGEEADYLTVSPIFNAVGSDWIMWDHVWGYGSEEERRELPRRGTLVTHSRASRRLLAAMHAEDMAGNHVASEMTPQTVALLHGFKAVYAPLPVFFDRGWDGKFLQRWFNPGPGGSAGGRGSAMGWGRERRWAGSTWYYRASPPSRLYNNWIGYPDHWIGGPAWEAANGRPCLPALLLHPIKEVKPTADDFESVYELFYG